MSAKPSIYDDGSYLKANENWHEEDSAYKAGLIAGALKRRSISFSSCVEVGCGSGAIVGELASRFPDARFAGYDISSDAERFWPKREARNLRFVRDDILKAEETFDLLLCLDVLEHVDDYIGFLRALRAKARHFVFKIPLDMSVVKILTKGLRYARETSGHLHYFNHYTSIETLKYAGYTIDEAKLDAAFLSVPPRNLRQVIALLPRLLLSLGGHRLGSKLMGGYTLLVVAH